MNYIHVHFQGRRSFERFRAQVAGNASQRVLVHVAVHAGQGLEGLGADETNRLWKTNL